MASPLPHSVLGSMGVQKVGKINLGLDQTSKWSPESAAANPKPSVWQKHFCQTDGFGLAGHAYQNPPEPYVNFLTKTLTFFKSV